MFQPSELDLFSMASSLNDTIAQVRMNDNYKYDNKCSVVAISGGAIFESENRLHCSIDTQESHSEGSARNLSKSNRLEDEMAKDFHQPILFTLKYLPRLMAESEVLSKIQKFGKISSFKFKPEIAQKGIKDQKGNFKRAEFSFEEMESEDIFKKVKRIRIKGLQVKILQGDSEEQQSSVDPMETVDELKNIAHDIRPTNRLYNSKIRETVGTQGLEFRHQKKPSE